MKQQKTSKLEDATENTEKYIQLRKRTKIIIRERKGRYNEEKFKNFEDNYRNKRFDIYIEE